MFTWCTVVAGRFHFIESEKSVTQSQPNTKWLTPNIYEKTVFNILEPVSGSNEICILSHTIGGTAYRRDMKASNDVANFLTSRFYNREEVADSNSAWSARLARSSHQDRGQSMRTSHRLSLNSRFLVRCEIFARFTHPRDRPPPSTHHQWDRSAETRSRDTRYVDIEVRRFCCALMSFVCLLTGCLAVRLWWI